MLTRARRPMHAMERTDDIALDRRGSRRRADLATGSLFLFGGRDAAGAPLGDSWIYAAADNAWSPLDGPAPAPRFGHAVAVDTENRALYLFGGKSNAGPLADFWVLAELGEGS